MQRVSDPTGRQYVVVKRSAEATLVRDPETRTVRYLPNDQLEPVTDAEPDRDDGTATVDLQFDPALDVVRALDRDRPVSVRKLLADTSCCESDLHGVLGDLTAGGFVEAVEVGQERAYTLTDAGRKLAGDVASVSVAETDTDAD